MQNQKLDLRFRICNLHDRIQNLALRYEILILLNDVELEMQGGNRIV